MKVIYLLVNTLVTVVERWKKKTSSLSYQCTCTLRSFCYKIDFEEDDARYNHVDHAAVVKVTALHWRLEISFRINALVCKIRSAISKCYRERLIDLNCILNVLLSFIIHVRINLSTESSIQYSSSSSSEREKIKQARERARERERERVLSSCWLCARVARNDALVARADELVLFCLLTLSKVAYWRLQTIKQLSVASSLFHVDWGESITL